MVKKSGLVVGLLVTYFGLIFTSGEYGQLVHPTNASLTVNGTPQQYGTEFFLVMALIITLIGLLISYIAIFNPKWIKTNRSKSQSYHSANSFNQHSQDQIQDRSQLQKIIEIQPSSSENYQQQSIDYSNINNLLGSLEPVDEDSTAYSNDYSDSFDSSPHPSNDYSDSFDSSSEPLNDYSESFVSFTQSTASDKTCSFCGAMIESDEKFCNNCGKRL